MRSATHGYCMLLLAWNCEWRGRAVPLFKRPQLCLAWSCSLLILLFASFLTAALARQRFFHVFSFAGLQVEGVTFDFLDDVLGLYLSLEPAKRVLERFSLLKSNFSQRDCTSLLALTGPVSYGKPAPHKSSGMCVSFSSRLRNSAASTSAFAAEHRRLSPS